MAVARNVSCVEKVATALPRGVVVNDAGELSVTDPMPERDGDAHSLPELVADCVNVIDAPPLTVLDVVDDVD